MASWPLFVLSKGILERQETGEVAKAVLAGCEDSPLSTAESLLLTPEAGTREQKEVSSPYSSSCKLPYSSLSPSAQVSAEEGKGVGGWGEQKRASLARGPLAEAKRCAAGSVSGG